ncbi:AMP-binding protein [Pseudoduganella umbonata]|uniref:AMP-binding protein n=1 Tax=Pseudoduganella umbonata TaxID=864828 RepID=A0A4P8HRU8_9BURK|nr:AMP-binding protein [Pseudoduganella umbonata]MBB3224398.1 acyl-coenzyme A synthetase/AMP-(fatty) acid ligase [Pseudoduganella umbonata]QCP11240.1 AMP-binding protein [Pseudoduganella umbonata]
MCESLSSLAVRLAARPSSIPVGVRAGGAVGTAAFLARLGAWRTLLRQHPGSRFALYVEDSIEFAAALLGAWQAGKTVWLAADTLDATCANLREHVHGFLGEFPAGCAPLVPTEAHVHSEALRELNPEADALVVFTSGSTGAAQAIPKKLRQMASEVATLEVLFGARAGAAAVIATVSHQHIYGLLFKVLWPLNTGRPIHAASIAFPEALAAALAAQRCVLVASPAHLKRLPAHLDWRGARTRLAAVFSSGGPLPADTAQTCGSLLGSVPVEVFGSSETGGIAWRQRAALPSVNDDAWTPFPTVAWRLHEGFLEVRSPHLPDDGWLPLADRAQALQGRRFQLLGRGDRIAKIEEKRISLDAIEAALLASGLAAEARVALCEPDDGHRQVLAAFVVPAAAGRAVLEREGKLALNGRLRAVLAGVVDAVALPRRWRYLDALPVNAQGKTTVAALLALLAAAPADPLLAAAVTDPLPANPAVRPRLPHVRELERDGDGRRVLLEIVAPANLAYFDGHFTQAPILPGVAQVEWAIRFGRDNFALPPAFRAMHALKFQHVIQPDLPVQLELLHDPAKGQLTFAYRSPAGQHASGRILFHAEPAHA